MKTSPEVRKTFGTAGFVRVDGLQTWSDAAHSQKRGMINPVSGEITCRKGGVQVIYTQGEVWIASVPTNTSRVFEKIVQSFNQGDVFVPCSNQEHVGSHHLLKRFSDPDWQWGK